MSAAPLPQRVFQRLDDRDYRSGEALAADLEVTRAAVWKAVEQLRELGLELDAQTNRGYRLAAGVSALSAERIAARLPVSSADLLDSLRVEWTLESTNTRLLEEPPPAAGRATVVLAEHQTGGRGRRGRGWIAPPGGAICLSVAWSFAEMPDELSALSLAVGACAAQALAAIGVDVRLKWPNDLMTKRGKLGGILIEMRAEAGGPVFVVVGLGLNVRLDVSARAAVKAAGAVADDLASHGAVAPDRNEVAAAVLAALLPALDRFAREGFAPHHPHWSARDALRDRAVCVENAGEISRGLARGIDAHGALLVETPAGVRRFVSGEVTVRAE